MKQSSVNELPANNLFEWEVTLCYVMQKQFGFKQASPSGREIGLRVPLEEHGHIFGWFKGLSPTLYSHYIWIYFNDILNIA